MSRAALEAGLHACINQSYRLDQSPKVPSYIVEQDQIGFFQMEQKLKGI